MIDQASPPAMSRWRSIISAADAHSGLGSWAGAVFSVVAIFATWGITWNVTEHSYRRDQQEHKRQRRSEIELFQRVIVAYNQIVDPMLDSGNLAQLNLNDPSVSAAVDLAWIPVTQWPSVESYLLFKQYWTACQSLTQPSPNGTSVNAALIRRLFGELSQALASAHRLAEDAPAPAIDGLSPAQRQSLQLQWAR